MEKGDMTRFDARISKEQKEYLEYASKLGGFRSLTEFIIQSAQARANEIIDEHNQILASKKDQELFFKALLNPENPNQELKAALLDFNKAVNNG